MVTGTEHKLLIAFFTVTVLLGTVRTVDWMVWSYRQSVEAAEREKEILASGKDKIQFSGCNPCTSDPHETILPAQGILLLFALGLFAVRKHWSIGISSGILLLILYGYCDWSQVTSANIRGSEFAYQYSYQSYLLLGSTKLDFVVLIFTFSLLILQIALMVRFGAEKLRARLTSSDKTLST